MTSEQIDREVAQIQAANLAGMLGKRVIALVIEEGSFELHEHTHDSVMPQSTYPNARAAAARILQLLRIGPVAPQTWPETAEIGSIDGDSHD